MKIKLVEVRQSEKQKKHNLSFINFCFITDMNLEPSQLSKMELLGNLVNDLISLSFFEQSSILDVMRF